MRLTQPGVHVHVTLARVQEANLATIKWLNVVISLMLQPHTLYYLLSL